jgi:hypothetical protein
MADSEERVLKRKISIKRLMPIKRWSLINAGVFVNVPINAGAFIRS